MRRPLKSHNWYRTHRSDPQAMIRDCSAKAELCKLGKANKFAFTKEQWHRQMLGKGGANLWRFRTQEIMRISASIERPGIIAALRFPQ